MADAGAWAFTGTGGSRKLPLAAPTQALITSPWALVSLVTSLFVEFPGTPGWSQYMLAELEFGGQPRAGHEGVVSEGFGVYPAWAGRLSEGAEQGSDSVWFMFYYLNFCFTRAALWRTEHRGAVTDKRHCPSERLRDQRTRTDRRRRSSGEVQGGEWGTWVPNCWWKSLSPDIWEDTGFVRKDGAALERMCMLKSKMMRKAEGTLVGLLWRVVAELPRTQPSDAGSSQRTSRYVQTETPPRPLP